MKDLDTIRHAADRLHAHLTDYTYGVEPSLLFKAIYLTEAERVLGELRPDVLQELQHLRRVIASATGL